MYYWVVRKVRADFEGKLKCRRFKFLISFIKFKSFAARTFRTTQYTPRSIYVYIYIYPLMFNVSQKRITIHSFIGLNAGTIKLS